MRFAIVLGDVSRELDLNSMTIREARECKALTGWTWDRWRIALAEGDADAIAYAWWLACQRAGEPIGGAFLEVDFDMGDLEIRSIDVPDAEPVAAEEEPGPTGSATAD